MKAGGPSRRGGRGGTTRERETGETRTKKKLGGRLGREGDGEDSGEEGTKGLWNRSCGLQEFLGLRRVLSYSLKPFRIERSAGPRIIPTASGANRKLRGTRVSFSFGPDCEWALATLARFLVFCAMVFMGPI